VNSADPSVSDIYVADDDAMVRKTIAVVLSRDNFRVSGFVDGEALLAAVRAAEPACVILDVSMPGRSGLDILKELQIQRVVCPRLIITGVGDIPMAVEAMRNGAYDFITKPFDPVLLVTLVREAIRGTAERQRKELSDGEGSLNFPGRELLSLRERDVLDLIVNGASNKVAGLKLRISPRTVEVHRARIIEKLGAKNTVDLVNIVRSKRGR
jgi:two-component system, LuxR family, response regulator FixJ